MDKIKIVIADDQSIIRDGLNLILEMEEDMEVAGLAGNGDEALELVGKIAPDIVLMDIHMPVCDGVLGTRKICEAYPGTKVMILTTFSDDTYIFEALRYGAKGYLLKDVQSEELAKAIRAVVGGSVLIHPVIAAKMVQGMQSGSKNTERPAATTEPLETGTNGEELTPRETEIVRLIGKGLSNREIAAQLFVSEGTVKNHITNILSKLYLRDRTQIALYAAQHNL